MAGRNPEPLDESLPPPETRGGNRPEDYMPEDAVTWHDVDHLDADEPLGGNDEDAQ